MTFQFQFFSTALGVPWGYSTTVVRVVGPRTEIGVAFLSPRTARSSCTGSSWRRSGRRSRRKENVSIRWVSSLLSIVGFEIKLSILKSSRWLRAQIGCPVNGASRCVALDCAGCADCVFSQWKSFYCTRLMDCLLVLAYDSSRRA